MMLNPEATRAYVTLTRNEEDSEKSPHVNGLLILDISQLQGRTPNPQFRVLGTQFWDDSHYAQFALPVQIGGRPYLIYTDLMGAVGFGRPPPPGVCKSGKAGHGFARILDLSDEKRPKTISKLMLEVHEYWPAVRR